ncbi:MAG TPA: hypothetical protein VFM28_12170 [Nitrososphaeraceae archaeon]|jgi:hypothetical protein|nr:hypothetical protein [Nitrososphaeraceae archaeon]
MRINTLVMFLLICNLAPVFIGKEIFSQPGITENWQLSSVLLEKESDKGNYLIQLKSSYSHDVHNFPIEIVFLNSTKPTHTAPTVPYLESNNTGDVITGSGLSVPSILERVVPIQNYDIAIYDGNGKELWKKTSQVATEGRGTQNVEFVDFTGGELTVVIDKILASKSYTNRLDTDLPSRVEGTNNTDQSSSQYDSVTFTTTLSKT